MIGIIYLILTGLAGTIIFKKDKFGAALPITIMLHVVIVMISGLICGDLRPGLYFGILAELIIVISAVWHSKNIKYIFRVIISPDTIFFVIVYMILFFLNQRQVYTEWDEYSHWGPMAREMFRLNDFYFKSDRTFSHRDYVPFVTVFEYILCRLEGKCTMAMVYQGIHVFMVSLFSPLLSWIGSKITKWYSLLFQLFNIVAVTTCLIFLTTCFSFFHSIYNDLPFGLLCGFAMAYCYYREKPEKISHTLIVELTVIMTSVVMTKMMGIIFVPVIIVMTWLMLFKEWNILDRLKVIIPQTVIPLIIWEAYKVESKQYIAIEGTQSFDGAASGIINLIFHGFTYDYQRTVAINYVTALFKTFLVASGATYFVLMVGAPVICIIFIKANHILHRNDKSNVITLDRYRSRMLTLGMVLTGIYYAVWMYIMYQVSFGDYEAVILASFNRYMGTYVASSVIIVLYLIAGQFNLIFGDENEDVKRGDYITPKQISKTKKLTIIAALVMTLVIMWYNSASGKTAAAYDGYLNNQDSIDELREAEIVAENILPYMEDDNSSVLFILQNSNGYQALRYNYYLMDKVSNLYWVSVKASADEIGSEDTWSVVKSPSDLKEYFLQYDYVYIDILDETFIEEYGQLFEKTPEVGDFYKVNADDESIELIAN